MKLKKHTLNLFDGDWDELARQFPGEDTSRIVREVVHSFVEKRKSRLAPTPILKLKEDLDLG